MSRLTEVKPTFGEDPVYTPESVAMSKLIDIHKAHILKHGFVRFGPVELDPTNPYSLQDTAVPANDRLAGIFKLGIITPRYAKRIGEGITRNWSDTNNLDYISLGIWGSSMSGILRVTVRTAIQPHVPTKRVVARDVFVVLVDSDAGWGGHYVEESGEFLVRTRIRQKLFRGIAVIDKPIPIDFYTEAPLPVDSDDHSPQATVDEVVRLMRTHYASRTELYIPVYGISGGVYWPTRLSYEQVQTLVA